MVFKILQKLGFWSKKIINKWKEGGNWLWFHAVSVGEFKAVWPLIQEINKIKKEYSIMLSCTTDLGYKLAKETTKDLNIFVFYFPFDLPFIINKLLTHAKVKALFITETEIWPFTIQECFKRKIPLFLINARLSDKSFEGYYLFRLFFKTIINKFSLILTQSKSDEEKFKKIGIDPEKIKTLGNIKFASQSHDEVTNGNLNFKKDSNITRIMFASTHKGEEEIAIKAHQKLLTELNNIQLIIAPRHLNRVNEVTSTIKRFGYNPILKSKNNITNSNTDVYIIDTMGELNNYYNIADISFVGGSFVEIGGHNILEPIRAGSFTIIGPYDFKIKEMSTLFKLKNALVQVTNLEELTSTIKEAAIKQQYRDETVKNGKKILEENLNVLTKTVEQLIPFI